MRTALAALLLVAACTDSTPGGEPDDPHTFDGEWTRRGISTCAPQPGGACAVPGWYDDSADAAIDTGVLRWTVEGDVQATHAGTIASGCLSIPAGNDDGLSRDAYELCPADGDEIAGSITWGRGTLGQCTCDFSLAPL